jgi:hypothetical protein
MKSLYIFSLGTRTSTPNRFMGRGEPDEAKVADLKGHLNLKLDAYDKILSKQPYLAGQVSGTYLPFVTI